MSKHQQMPEDSHPQFTLEVANKAQQPESNNRALKPMNQFINTDQS